MTTYTPFCHTHLSFLQALSKPNDLAKRLADYNISSCCITDYDILAGCVKFYEACKKNNIKPILGTKVVVKTLSTFGYVTLIAKNLAGWKELMKISSQSYLNGNTPQVSLGEIYDTQNLLVLSGYNGSLVANSDSKFLLCDELSSALGENFVLQVERHNTKSIELADEIIDEGKKHNIMCVAGPRSLYVDKSDLIDYQVLLASHLKTTVRDLDNKVKETQNEELLNNFFSLLSPNEVAEQYSEELLKNTNIISDMCESYNILNKPNLPMFTTPNGETDIDYLRQLCRDGWKKKVVNKVEQVKYTEYVDRVKYELGVIAEAKLSPYFLIVQDYVNWAKNQGWLLSPGRGSSSGSLICHLTNITNVDPIKYGLLFERFYNAGRNTKDNISLPDIDTDFPPNHREEVIQYITNKYGKKHVAQVATFGRLQGRGILKEIFRTHNVCSAGDMNIITENIPAEDKISDKLEEENETSILRWTLNNEPKNLEQWCTLKDGKYEGDYAQYFAQAVRMEGTYKGFSKHASALCICGDELNSMVPMIKEKTSDELLVGVEFKDAERCGVVKIDALSVNVLTKLADIATLLKFGELR